MTFAKRRPCYSVQEELQLRIVHSTFLQKRKECTRQADIHHVVQKALKSHTDLQSYPGERQ